MNEIITETSTEDISDIETSIDISSFSENTVLSSESSIETTITTIPFLQRPLSQYEPQEMSMSIIVICLVIIILVLSFRKGI